MRHIGEIIKQRARRPFVDALRMAAEDRIKNFRRLYAQHPDNPWYLYEMKKNERELAELNRLFPPEGVAQ